MDDSRADNLYPGEMLPEAEQLDSTRQAFEDLSVLQLINLLIVRPGQTWGVLRETLDDLETQEAARKDAENAEAEQFSEKRAPTRAAYIVDFGTRPAARTIDWQALRPLAIFSGAAVLTLFGSFIVNTSGPSPSVQSLIVGGIIMLIGTGVIAAMIARRVTVPPMKPLELPLPELSAEQADALPAPTAKRASADARMSFLLRLSLLVVSMIWIVGSWIFNANNQFTPVGVFCWIMSIITLTAALVNPDTDWTGWLKAHLNSVRAWVREPVIKFRPSWTAPVLIAILLIGAWYRFNNLSIFPPEMTSDHVEKILDSVRVYNGARDIFFSNNGGREAFQFYFLPILKSITGLPWGFDLLKLASGIEGMVMILMAWWMGRAIFGEENRQFGNLVGLIMAGLIAVSFWHTLLSRLGLRIVTTPLVVTFVLIFLARGLRYNRRTDFLIAGLGLGAGMYFYQSIRILPLVIIAGVILALIMRSRSRRTARHYIANFVALTLISLAVFVPLGRYMFENPSEFWNRTAGRLFGDATIQDNSGNMTRVPFDQRLASFSTNLPILGSNLVKSVLMFNWQGDGSWFNGSTQRIPALDFFAGALFVAGLAFLVVRVRKRRDPVDLLLPISVLIMVLPSALAIAFPIEVPGFTRGSGALPMVYLIAAFGLAVIFQALATWATTRTAQRVVLVVIVVLFLFGGVSNVNAYFGEAMSGYRESTLPHKQAGQLLRGFIDSTGAPGNAFIVAYQYWWDHRAVAIEAGDLTWHNTLPSHDQLDQEIFSLMQLNEGSQYAVQPDRQLMFFLNQEDKDGMSVISKMFPAGSMIRIPAYNTTRDFYIYVVPPVGCDWLTKTANLSSPSCPDTSTLDQTPTPAQ